MPTLERNDKSDPDNTDRAADIVIAGAGIVGLSAALALAQKNFKVTIVEALGKNKFQVNKQLEDNTRDIRAIALSASNWRQLARYLTQKSSEQLALQLYNMSSPIWDMRIVEAHPLRGVESRKLHLSHKDLYCRLGHKNSTKHETVTPLGYIVEGQDLLQILYRGASTHENINIEHETKLQNFNAAHNYIEVLLAHKSQTQKKSIRAKLLLACDGKNSSLREQANIACRKKDYKESALVCALAHERAHSGTAVEWFTPLGTFASLPMLNQQSGIVWCDKHHNILELIELEESEFIKHAQTRFGRWLGKISLASKRVAYPVSLSHAHSYVAQRLALLGDAAHAIHPLAGQGLNLGLRDVVTLVKQITEAEYLGEDFASSQVLKRYEKIRRRDANSLIFVTDSLHKIFTNDSTILREIRLSALTLIDKIPLARRAIVRAAAESS